MVNKDINEQKNVWCFNLNTGDKYNNLKWREYYQIPLKKKPKNSHASSDEGCFTIGSEVGVLIDTKKGQINFYLNG